MPEGGLQQLFIVVLFVVFGLIDLIGRWAKGRRGNDGDSALPSPTRWPRMEWPDEAEERGADGRTWRPIDAPPPVEVPAPAKPRMSSTSAEHAAPKRIAVSAREVAARAGAASSTTRSALKPLVPAAAAPTVQRRTAVLDVREARRAVIAATVLGPCLALRDD